MGAKRSAEMKEALRLHEAGVNAHAAARKAGVLPSSFYRLLAEERLKPTEPPKVRRGIGAISQSALPKRVDYEKTSA